MNCRAFILATVFIFSASANAQTDSTRGKRFQLIGTIAGDVQLTADCGIIAWGTVIEFEVIELVGMNYSNKNLAIIITCPESFGDNFFKKGYRYLIEFSDKNQAGFGWVIPNRGVLKKNGLSFEPYAVSVQRLKRDINGSAQTFDR